jgi:hypothetical protein
MSRRAVFFFHFQDMRWWCSLQVKQDAKDKLLFYANVLEMVAMEIFGGKESLVVMDSKIRAMKKLEKQKKRSRKKGKTMTNKIKGTNKKGGLYKERIVSSVSRQFNIFTLQIEFWKLTRRPRRKGDTSLFVSESSSIQKARYRAGLVAFELGFQHLPLVTPVP